MASSRIQVSNGNDELTISDGIVTIGGRNDVDVILADVMVADRHCVIVFEDGFRVRDTGSVTGTWVDGQRANPTAQLHDGSKIVIGSTQLAVAIGDEAGTATLQLTVDPQSFWWKRAGKGTFDNDPDQLVYSEAKFAHFPTLQLGNRVAIVGGLVLLVAATLVASVMEPLADAGPLQPTHAVVASASVGDGAVPAGFQECVELSAEQGCNVCHTTGSGTPEAKCQQCHGLPGEMGHVDSWRHPYHNDGNLAALPGITADEQFCVICHTDHQGATTFKAAAEQLLGNCEACHHDGSGTFDRDALIQRAEIKLPPPVSAQYETYRFPHDSHLAKEIGCEVCHQIDPQVRADLERGVPDDPNRHDFAVVDYAICASCHVPQTEPVNMTASQQRQWRPEKFQWQVLWHGTQDDGKYCLACHSSTERAGVSVFGPEMKSVARGVFSAEQYADERARYSSTSRSHDDQFAQHAEGKACTECHLDGKVDAGQTRPQRPFWHALHVAAGSLAPSNRALAASISSNTDEGCASCHDDLDAAVALKPAADGAYHWPEDSAAQAACKQCHREGRDQQLLLRPARLQLAAERTKPVPDFPHDAHLNSSAYGEPGSALEQRCFACHDFGAPEGGDAFSLVPRTRPEAQSCVSCHGGHDHVGGGDCQQCHPAEADRSNSFLVSAKSEDPAKPMPTRPWPAPNSFSHLSPGHVGDDLTCATCHDGFGLEQAKTLGDVRVPDETAKGCRECHLEKQFHWR